MAKITVAGGPSDALNAQVAASTGVAVEPERVALEFPVELHDASKGAVLAWVDGPDDDAADERVNAALNYERAKPNPRVTLVAELEARQE